MLVTYVDQDRKAEIDWSDPAKRSAQLKVLVADSEASLELALEQIEDSEICSLGWTISKILDDDVEHTPEADCKIGKGTAPDRFISLHDPDIRHGRKSAFSLDNQAETATCPQGQTVTASHHPGGPHCPHLRFQARWSVTCSLAVSTSFFEEYIRSKPENRRVQTTLSSKVSYRRETV